MKFIMLIILELPPPNKIVLMSKIIADTGTEVSVYSLRES